MKKIVFFFCGLLLLFTVTGCSRDIPEGDIKDFVMQIEYNKAYDFAKTGKSIVTSTYYVNEQIDGQVCVTTYYDKSSKTKYFYKNTDASGSYHGDGSGQYNYTNEQILSYVNADDTLSTLKKVDGSLIQTSFTEEELNKSIEQFFYMTVEGGYHGGGSYYGDYVLANCAKFYNCFSLNEDKTVLSYEVNTSSTNSENEEIVTMHKFTVNEYGLIISLSSKSIYIARNIVLHTTIECEYNIEVEKINEL